MPLTLLLPSRFLNKKMYLFGERGVAVDVPYLIIAEFFEAITVLGALTALREALGHGVVKAMVVLARNRVILKGGVALCCVL